MAQSKNRIEDLLWEQLKICNDPDIMYELLLATNDHKFTKNAKHVSTPAPLE